jgi:hypothetical protein
VYAPVLRTVPVVPEVLVTVTGPVVAVEGTVAVSFVADTYVTRDAATPLNFTTAPGLNPTPLIVTTVAGGPELGLKPVTENVGVKFEELDPVPAAVVTEIFAANGMPFGTFAVIFVAEFTV